MSTALPNEIKASIKAFIPAIKKSKDLAGRLQRFKAFYAIPAGRGFQMAPARWAGYGETSPRKYMAQYQLRRGPYATTHLARWFRPASRAEAAALRQALHRNVAAVTDCVPTESARFFVLK